MPASTGTAEGIAYETAKKLKPCRSTVASCAEVDPATILEKSYDLVLFVTSTFGDGRTPAQGVEFNKKLEALPITGMAGIDYAILAIG